MTSRRQRGIRRGTPAPARLADARRHRRAGRAHRAPAARRPAGSEHAFAESMHRHPIALFPAMPMRSITRCRRTSSPGSGPAAEIFVLPLSHAGTTLAEAEELALAETAAHADLADGQDILELGCGWGSLIAVDGRALPAARITAVSNSAPQREHIETEAGRAGLLNVTVITADMNRFRRPIAASTASSRSRCSSTCRTGRSCWPASAAGCGPTGGCSCMCSAISATPYRFDHTDQADWIAQHFFTGGIMPSHDLIRHVADAFTLEAGMALVRHALRPHRAGLACAISTRHADAIEPDRCARPTARTGELWRRRWRLFFLATAGLFGAMDGTEWGVSHYRLRLA